MRSSVILAVFALAAFVAANESAYMVLPEVATGSAAVVTGTPYVTDKQTVQTHYETEEVPEKEIIEKPVYENVTVPWSQSTTRGSQRPSQLRSKSR